jgi:DNA-binding transcriptional regulator YiaG
MNNMGSMLDCAVNVANCDATVFYEMFLASGIANQIEDGNPRYLSGMSGTELMLAVLKNTSDKVLPEIQYTPFERTPEYWACWALAYYQWVTSQSFSYIQRNGLDINTIISLYPTLHEADLSKFVQTADSIISRQSGSNANTLKTLRKQSHLTQKGLAELSGVSLRMIQAYEQGDQNILKAEAQTIFALSRVLGCAPEAICGVAAN